MPESGSSNVLRVAIKFGGAGAKKSDSKPSRPNPPPSLLGKRPRHKGLGNSDSEASEDEGHGRHETITGFDSDGGAELAPSKDDRRKRKKSPLVIKPQPTRDWRAEINARRIAKDKDTEPADGEKKIIWGLNLLEKKQPEDAAENAPSSANDENAPPVAAAAADSEPPKSMDDQALDRLLGKTEKEQVQRVIKVSEAEALRRDIDSAADVPALAEYDEMPVEEFGAALLRGMGWDGKDNRPKPKTATRRPNLMGLGAKELKEAEDLGAWNNGNKKRPPRLAEYNERNARDARDDRVKAGGGSYKQERERERERGRGQSGHHHHHNREREKDRERERERDRDYRDRDRNRERDNKSHGGRDRDRDHDRDRYRDHKHRSSRR